MLDTALIDALSHALKPQPAIVRPATEVGETFAAFGKRTDAQLAAAEAGVDAWIARGRTARAAVSADLQAALDAGMPSEAVVPTLDLMISRIEDVSRESGADFDELAASFKRQIKQSRQLGVQEAAIFERIADQAMSLMQRELDERSDFVLFLKSWRSEFSPGGRGGPHFDDPDALDRYLREATAA